MMKKVIFCFVASLILAGGMNVALQGQRTGDYRDPEWTHDQGYTNLFNGKDLSGWLVVLKSGDQARRFRPNEVDQQSTFFVQDGMLMTTGTPNGYVRTEGVYDNFVFSVDVRFTQAGNSGVLIHVQRDDVWPRGIECQLYQAHMGRIFPIQGATLEGGEMIHSAAKPPGEWNTYQVYSEEGRVATVLNGVVVGLASNANPRAGYICLQAEGVPAEFRNIRVRRHTPAHLLRPKP